MTIYYLYVKTHNINGLKYLGYTKRKDPYKYKGSGKDWKSHVKEHGYDVTTEIIKECNSHKELSEWGRFYSELWNVVDSNEWANKIPETGGGGNYGKWNGDRERVAAWSRASNLARVTNGTHNLMGCRNPSHLRVAEGTHNFQGSNNPSRKKAADGTHHMFQNNNHIDLNHLMQILSHRNTHSR